MKGSYLSKVYCESFGLLTDLYELTMAYGYWKEKMEDREAVFHLFFRKKPFDGSFAVVAGMETALEFIERFRFEKSDLEYLRSLKDSLGKPLFEVGFLDYLKDLRLRLSVDAMEEGSPVFPYEPLIRVQGPILHAQIMESALLNIINFQTLIATKAARICFAANPDVIVEFGLRRAQGIDGAIAASRSAFIGGCHSTSNVIAGKLFGIPVKGTHAHSWVMAFDHEIDSFRAFARALPRECIFLIDTYDSVEGAKRAVKVAKEMRKEGKEMVGVRLDSGDLTHLSIEVRKILDEGGFPKAKIMASNELDEYLIFDLKHQGSKVTIWGVGTNLVTAKGQSALDGVYKLSAIKDRRGKWQYRLKISEQMSKVTLPGIPQVRRYFNEKGAVADMIYDVAMKIGKPVQMFQLADSSVKKKIHPAWSHRDLLVPMMKKGKKIYSQPSLEAMRKKTYLELSTLPVAMRRFLNPSPHFVGIEKGLYDLKLAMIDELNKGIS
ncbi:MAG: nicotinate phosphoribosyltransferase [Chlamydiae bacterium]|nr:nicotinate phosphoribosyltransferase [Chlamydiota bacterium]